MEHVALRLAATSSRFAQTALEAFPVGDDEGFALAAGIALEHALKCVLARRHPALIVVATDFDSLLHACGYAGDARIARRSVKSITARESLNRVGHLYPTIQNLSPRLAPLLEARNGVAHLAEPISAEELRVPFLQAAEELREVLEIGPDEYWGPFTAVVDAALNEYAEAAQVRVESALAAARIEFDRRYRYLTKEACEAVFRALEATYRLTKYEDALVDCPACARSAMVSGATETRFEREHDDDVSFFANFVPGYLRCRICDLELDGEAELRLAGIEASWEIDDASPEDFYGDDGY